MKKTLVGCCLMLFAVVASAQSEPDKIYMPNIHGVKFFVKGDQMNYPIINLGATSVLELHFDDLDNNVKNYYYTFQICDADWLPAADLGPFDYLKGFTQNTLSQYTSSSVAKTSYIHYQALLPENDCVPTRTGNYLLKVYLNGDTSQIAFTRRVLVKSSSIPITAQVLQPFDTDKFKTHQKLQFSIDVSRLDLQNPQQQLKVVVLQNHRWDNAIIGMQPMFMRQNVYEYNGERDFLFPAGKEYRWLDLQSFRLLSDRVKSLDQSTTPFTAAVAPDGERTQQRYLYYKDYNGGFQINNTDDVDPWTQADYANVHFSFMPDDKHAYDGKDVYIIGQFTDNAYNSSAKLNFNADKGVYEKTLLLKQGYYNYTYVTKDAGQPDAPADASITDGNYWETENDYTILVYYRSYSDRTDELVGMTTINSLASRQVK